MILRRVSPPSVVLAVMVGVVVAGCGEKDTALARYGDDGTFTVEDYQEELTYLLEDGQTLEDLELTPATFLDRAVRFRVLQIEAVDRMPTLAPGDQARLALYQESLLYEMLLEEVYPEPLVFSETEVMKAYEAKAWAESHLLHFQSRMPALAAEVTAAVDGGEPFAEVAARVASSNPLDAQYHDMSFMRRDQLPPEWETAAFSLEPGQTSGTVATRQGHHLFHCAEVRRTPYRDLRPYVVEELERAEKERRLQDLERELLTAARFRVDSTTVALVADRFATHRDSLSAAGVESANLAIPRFSDPALGRTLFEVAGTPFTVQALLAELSAVPGPPLGQGEELDRFHNLARRRAFSDVVMRVAEQRGLIAREDFQKRVDRKRRELHMNTLLRELWRGLGPTEDEVRDQIRARGDDVPGPEGLRVVTFQLQRQRQAERLAQYLEQLVEKYEVEIYPDRIPDVS